MGFLGKAFVGCGRLLLKPYPVGHLSCSYAFGNFTHFAPSLELFTTVSMKAMP